MTLTAIGNLCFASLHVDLVGYPKDLLFATNEAEVPDVLDRLGIRFDVWERWVENERSLPIVPEGERLARERMGDSWEQLSPQVKSFLASAMLDWHDRQEAPNRDYASISGQLAKCVETELRRKPLKGSLLARAWDSYRAQLANADYLRGSHFHESMNRLIDEYRNGGAHDHLIPLPVCARCVDEVVGTREHPGMLSGIVSWKPSLQSSPDTVLDSQAGQEEDTTQLGESFYITGHPMGAKSITSPASICLREVIPVYVLVKHPPTCFASGSASAV